MGYLFFIYSILVLNYFISPGEDQKRFLLYFRSKFIKRRADREIYTSCYANPCDALEEIK